MPNLTSFNKLIFSFLPYFYIKVHGLVAAHKKIYMRERTLYKRLRKGSSMCLIDKHLWFLA